MPEDGNAIEPWGETLIPQWVFADTLSYMVKMINDLGKKIDAKAANQTE
jgi:hypothetical protein